MAKQKKMTVHKKVREDGRRNGKAFKQYPKAFDRERGRLVTDHALKGTAFPTP